MDLDGNFVSAAKDGSAIKVAFVVDSSYRAVYTNAGEQIVSIIEGRV